MVLQAYIRREGPGIHLTYLIYILNLPQYVHPIVVI